MRIRFHLLVALCPYLLGGVKNYKLICLVSNVYKILAKVLLKRVENTVDKTIQASKQDSEPAIQQQTTS